MVEKTVFDGNAVELKTISHSDILSCGEIIMKRKEEKKVNILIANSLFTRKIAVLSIDNTIVSVDMVFLKFIFDAKSAVAISKKVSTKSFSMFLENCIFPSAEEIIKFAKLAKEELERKKCNKLFDTLAEFELPKISLGKLKPDELSCLFKFLKWKRLKTNKGKEFYTLSHNDKIVGWRDFFSTWIDEGAVMDSVSYTQLYYGVVNFKGPNGFKESLFLNLIK